MEEAPEVAAPRPEIGEEVWWLTGLNPPCDYMTGAVVSFDEDGIHANVRRKVYGGVCLVAINKLVGRIDYGRSAA